MVKKVFDFTKTEPFNLSQADPNGNSISLMFPVGYIYYPINIQVTVITDSTVGNRYLDLTFHELKNNNSGVITSLRLSHAQAESTTQIYSLYLNGPDTARTDIDGNRIYNNFPAVFINGGEYLTITLDDVDPDDLISNLKVRVLQVNTNEDIISQ